MATDPLYQPITADQFLAMDFGTDRKFELDNGVIHMMTGRSAWYAHVAGNVYLALRLKLTDERCRSFNSDMGIRVTATTIRYPDLSVICRENWPDAEDAKAFDDPTVVFEILSPSTTTFDQGTKLYEYQSLESVQSIVLVDPVNRLTRTHHRRVDDTWWDTSFAQPHQVELPSIDVVLTEADIFAAL